MTENKAGMFHWWSFIKSMIFLCCLEIQAEMATTDCRTDNLYKCIGLYVYMGK